MKLLSTPGFTVETVEFNEGPQRFVESQRRFNVMALFGSGPLFHDVSVETVKWMPKISFPGRRNPTPITIDFGNAVAYDTCLTEDGQRINRQPRELEFNGMLFEITGIYPLEPMKHLGKNVWKCTFDDCRMLNAVNKG